MKNIVVAFFALLAISASAFADTQSGIKDNNTADSRKGTGSFGVKIWKALTVTPSVSTEQGLGTFVIATDNYTATKGDLANNTIEFTIAGEASQKFYYNIKEEEQASGDGVDPTKDNSITVDWTAGDASGYTAAATVSTTTKTEAALNTSGNYYIKATVSAVKAVKSTNNGGKATFTQEVTVTYNGI